MARRLWATRVDSETPAIMDSIAKDLGFKRINGDGVIQGSAGVLFDKIAQGHFKIIPNK